MMCLFVFLSSMHTVEKGVSFYIIYIYIYIVFILFKKKIIIVELFILF